MTMTGGRFNLMVWKSSTRRVQVVKADINARGLHKDLIDNSTFYFTRLSLKPYRRDDITKWAVAWRRREVSLPYTGLDHTISAIQSSVNQTRLTVSFPSDGCNIPRFSAWLVELRTAVCQRCDFSSGDKVMTTTTATTATMTTPPLGSSFIVIFDEETRTRMRRIARCYYCFTSIDYL